MKYLGFDLGASSGKMMLGELKDGILRTEILHRFPNRQICAANTMYWDVLNIYSNLKMSILKAADKLGADELSVGIDSFCNDFGLLDKQGRLINQVYCYRDERVKQKEKEIYKKVPKRKLYMQTGNQIASFNTVMQMAAMVEEENEYLLNQCSHALLIPDLLGYFLTGEMQTEYTLASVTQMMDWKTNAWHYGIMKQLGIREDIFPEIVPTGTITGKVYGDWNQELRYKNIQVVSVCGHDTASVIVALPTTKGKVAYISSGTWSIIGTEVDEPILTEETFYHNIAFEGGIDYRYRMIKNVMGLWILQECQNDYARCIKKECSYSFVQQEAENVRECRYLIDPDDDSFYMPGNMLDKVKKFCKRTGQGQPEEFGEIMRIVLESLALKYRYVLEKMEEILGYQFEKIYILGGGGKNQLLNQFTANACKKCVCVGDYEAGLVGNLIVQMRSHGEIKNLEEGRAIIKDSFDMLEFIPEKETLWEEKYSRFKELLKL